MRVQYLLDNWLPPRLRDSKLFMWLPMKLVLKDTTREFMTFKKDVFAMTPDEFGQLYARTAHVQELQGETDLNEACVEEIKRVISNKQVLEVGCGRGYLANVLQQQGLDVTACDIAISDQLRAKYPDVQFEQGNVEALPFDDDSFDTVVCTHTLEHVQNLPRAISELRRVAKNELIVVVPKQRPYKYMFSLHIQFFPYDWSLQGAFGHRKDAYIKYLGDWFYYEPTPHN